LADLLSLLPRFKATTLFAHWHSALFVPEHIAHPGSFLAKLRSCDFQCWQRIIGLRNLELSASQVPSSNADVSDVVRFLNLLLMRHATHVTDKPGDQTVEEEAWYDARAQLERIFPGAFRGGAGVDFADGW